MSSQRIVATYHVESDALQITERAKGLALEQSVECPLAAVPDPALLDSIVGRVETITELATGRYAVRIGLAPATAPPDPGQLINMLFGNSSIQQDVVLADVELPETYLRAFGGPRLGLAGIRALTGARHRALTASALKPQGLAPEALAGIAQRLALGGVDLIKDDHGLADQAYSPFAARAVAIGRAVRDANAVTGRHAIYAPNLSGTLDDMRRQLDIVRAEAIEAVLVAPMIVGLSNFHAIVREAAGLAVVAHPALSGVARIAPPLLLGRLFRLFGADATVFPNFGGRFAYTPETCLALAGAARDPWHAVKPCAPMPAGGIAVDRVTELLQFYGQDMMLLIGGALLAARERLTEEAARFVKEVAAHGNG
ncbi:MULTISPECIES: RuBisCO large subunit C-terminal-like domain-containing protein [Rhodopseudomonas]|uniref:Ribulose 1,5-bisphosphate carboxylase n=1 Tax=Rhodopseudomonas palustris TaxID=1076 RepID=A0A0D7F538_RHOPL|nr:MULTISPECIES: RuBisCO large subunit C-terminal-like domain-containing protein [Rhodopseudomonas]KIZ47911.1 ribulose 1,5-bisphosphate carboxylase [Rhodopseudomonas palustris]MDF3813624.1 RuBisCO large subunit C-terminal-like domain-containing protein [Rhodopseudomonas sp. BAL398]WOK17024.1 RuBisCO large subunit C-terminal-like domain-containing protein [Rhodopseudomonas sp. BAL398]